MEEEDFNDFWENEFSRTRLNCPLRLFLVRYELCHYVQRTIFLLIVLLEQIFSSYETYVLKTKAIAKFLAVRLLDL